MSSGEGLSGEANRSLRAKGREEGQIPEICISGDEVIGSKVAARERNHLLQSRRLPEERTNYWIVLELIRADFVHQECVGFWRYLVVDSFACFGRNT